VRLLETAGEVPTPPASFDAVLLVTTTATARLGGLSLVERAAFTMARAGARRLLCFGTRPEGALRLPPVPVSWVAGIDEPALDAWSGATAGVIVGMDARTVVDRDTVAALVTAPQADCLQAHGPGLLWRCVPAALTALVRAAIANRSMAPDVQRSCAGEAPALPEAVFWMPPSGALFTRADDASGRAAAERALYARLGRPGESWFNRVVDRRISRALTRLLLPTGVTPNQITCASIGLGIVAGLLFATGKPPAEVAGALLFLLSTIIDGCDGEIARLTFRESRLGARLDVVGDNVVHLFLFGGIAAGLCRRSPAGGFAVLGGLLVAGVVLAMATVYLTFVRRRPTPAQQALFEAFASREFSYLLVVLTLAGKLEWFLWVAAAGTYVFIASLLALGRRRPAQGAPGIDSRARRPIARRSRAGADSGSARN
jgi:phosphatidylglycerophosphate synthase